MRHFLISVLTLFISYLPMWGENVSLHWNEARGYGDFRYGLNDRILIENSTDSLIYDLYQFSSPARDISLTFKAKNLNGHPNKGYTFTSENGSLLKTRNPFWGFFITTVNDTLIFTVTNREIEKGIESEPGVEICLKDPNLKTRETVTFTTGLNPFDGFNIWKLTANQGEILLSGGNHGLKEIFSLPMNIEPVSGFGFLAGWGDCLEIRDINVTYAVSGLISEKAYDVNDLLEYLRETSDPMEGYWTIFDRELEESLLKLGGDYRLACVKEGEDYIFIYMEGAAVNRSNWQTGDIKAKMTPTSFPGIYNVEWYDSQKEPLSNDIKAQTGEGNTLTIQFPYQSSKLRLRKLPAAGSTSTTG